MLSLSQQVTLTYTNIFESKTLKKTSKHQNQAWGTKSKKQLKNSQYVFATWVQNWLSEPILCMNRPNKTRVNTLALTCIS
jgi:hypothetical protein